jgi:hypothetical protein
MGQISCINSSQKAFGIWFVNKINVFSKGTL